MIYDSGLDVIMGCGDPMEGSEYKFVGGNATWADIRDNDGANGFVYIHRVVDFKKLARGEINGGVPTKVMGIPHATNTLSGNPNDVPTLETMAMGAIRVLSQNPNGFFLMIEGGAVDWENHANNIEGMLKEQADFNNAVGSVKKWVEKNSSWKETLVIVTADHECGMLWGPGTYTDNNCIPDDKCSAGYYDAGIDTFNGWQHVKNNGKKISPVFSMAPGAIPERWFRSLQKVSALIFCLIWCKVRMPRQVHSGVFPDSILTIQIFLPL
jgi:alkaline phosphatase